MLFALKFKSQGLPLGKPNLGEKYKEEERSPHRSMRLCYVTQAAVRKYHRLGGLNNRRPFTHRCVRKSKIKEPAGLILGEGFLTSSNFN